MAPIAQSGPFGVQKRSFLARNQFFVNSLKKIVTIMTGHLKNNLFVLTALQGGLWGGGGGAPRPLFGPKMARKSDFLHYTHITHPFWSQTDSTQWDHNFPISWGNSGYLWVSGRCPFVCPAGCCMAPITENLQFCAQKCILFRCIAP